MLDATFPDREAVVLADLLDRHAREHPDKTFVVFADGQEWTYHQTAVISWTVAAGLWDQCGVGLGDVVDESLLARVRTRLAEVFFGDPETPFERRTHSRYELAPYRYASWDFERMPAGADRFAR